MVNKEILQNLTESAITTLQRLFKYTVSAGYFPMCLKTAVLKLIPKGSMDLTNLRNYRPISLFEVPAKY